MWDYLFDPNPNTHAYSNACSLVGIQSLDSLRGYATWLALGDSKTWPNSSGGYCYYMCVKALAKTAKSSTCRLVCLPGFSLRGCFLAPFILTSQDWFCSHHFASQPLGNLQATIHQLAPIFQNRSSTRIGYIPNTIIYKFNKCRI